MIELKIVKVVLSAAGCGCSMQLLMYLSKKYSDLYEYIIKNTNFSSNHTISEIAIYISEDLVFSLIKHIMDLSGSHVIISEVDDRYEVMIYDDYIE